MSNPFENEVIDNNEEKLILNDLQLKKSKKKKKITIITIMVILCCIMLGCLITFLVIGLNPKKDQQGSDKNLIETVLTNEQISKSSIDDREFRVVKLKNGLIATLIYDKKALTYSAGMGINVGYEKDGEIKGLVHFTEHMLFIGSETYPKVNSFMSLIKQNGGYTNAATMAESTIFYFRVNPSAFDTGLDMFCRMFNETLLKEKYIEKEINAVNSEFLILLNKDTAKEEYLISNLFGGQFPVGTIESLKEKGIPELLNQVKQLMRKYYVADNMKLVLIANEPLDSLQTRAFKYFGYLSNSTTIKNDIDIANMSQQETSEAVSANKYVDFHTLGQIGWIKKNSDQLSVDFALPYPMYDFKSNPLDFINYLLHDYNKGSFLYKYIENNYISSFNIIGVNNKTHHNEFYLHYVLTQKGINNLDEFIRKFFSYINKLKEKVIDPTIYEEYKKVSAAKFKFSIPESDTLILCKRMEVRKSDLKYLLYQEPSITSAYDAKLIQEALNYFSVNNVLILIGSKHDITKIPLQNMVENYQTFFDEQTEHYFKTKYNVQKLNSDYLNLLKTIKEYDEFSIRNTNSYITKEEKLILCNASTEICNKEYEGLVPIQVINEDNCHLYYRVS